MTTVRQLPVKSMQGGEKSPAATPTPGPLLPPKFPALPPVSGAGAPGVSFQWNADGNGFSYTVSGAGETAQVYSVGGAQQIPGSNGRAYSTAGPSAQLVRTSQSQPVSEVFDPINDLSQSETAALLSENGVLLTAVDAGNSPDNPALYSRPGLAGSYTLREHFLIWSWGLTPVDPVSQPGVFTRIGYQVPAGYCPPNGSQLSVYQQCTYTLARAPDNSLAVFISAGHSIGANGNVLFHPAQLYHHGIFDTTVGALNSPVPLSGQNSEDVSPQAVAAPAYQFEPPAPQEADSPSGQWASSVVNLFPRVGTLSAEELVQLHAPANQSQQWQSSVYNLITILDRNTSAQNGGLVFHAAAPASGGSAVPGAFSGLLLPNGCIWTHGGSLEAPLSHVELQLEHGEGLSTALSAVPQLVAHQQHGTELRPGFCSRQIRGLTVTQYFFAYRHGSRIGVLVLDGSAGALSPPVLSVLQHFRATPAAGGSGSGGITYGGLNTLPPSTEDPARDQWHEIEMTAEQAQAFGFSPDFSPHDNTVLACLLANGQILFRNGDFIGPTYRWDPLQAIIAAQGQPDSASGQSPLAAATPSLQVVTFSEQHQTWLAEGEPGPQHLQLPPPLLLNSTQYQTVLALRQAAYLDSQQDIVDVLETICRVEDEQAGITVGGTFRPGLGPLLFTPNGVLSTYSGLEQGQQAPGGLQLSPYSVFGDQAGSALQTVAARIPQGLTSHLGSSAGWDYHRVFAPERHSVEIGGEQQSLITFGYRNSFSNGFTGVLVLRPDDPQLPQIIRGAYNYAIPAGGSQHFDQDWHQINPSPSAVSALGITHAPGASYFVRVLSTGQVLIRRRVTGEHGPVDTEYLWDPVKAMAEAGDLHGGYQAVRVVPNAITGEYLPAAAAVVQAHDAHSTQQAQATEQQQIAAAHRGFEQFIEQLFDEVHNGYYRYNPVTTEHYRPGVIGGVNPTYRTSYNYLPLSYGIYGFFGTQGVVLGDGFGSIGSREQQSTASHGSLCNHLNFLSANLTHATPAEAFNPQMVYHGHNGQMYRFAVFRRNGGEGLGQGLLVVQMHQENLPPPVYLALVNAGGGESGIRTNCWIPCQTGDVTQAFIRPDGVIYFRFTDGTEREYDLLAAIDQVRQSNNNRWSNLGGRYTLASDLSSGRFEMPIVVPE